MVCPIDIHIGDIVHNSKMEYKTDVIREEILERFDMKNRRCFIDSKEESEVCLSAVFP